jgi:hypothetical protein
VRVWGMEMGSDEWGAVLLCVYQCLSVSIYQCVYVSMCLCVHLSMCLCVYVSLCLCVYVSLCLCVYVSMCLSVLSALPVAELWGSGKSVSVGRVCWSVSVLEC